MTVYDRLRQDCTAIWRAGVDAVTPDELFRRKVDLKNGVLRIDSIELDLRSTRRLIIVGGGKASAAMATALVERLSEGSCGQLNLEAKGWVNCPEGTFDPSCNAPEFENGSVHLCAARPAGVNSPTAAGVEGTRRILELVSSCGPQDVVISLISGGGSALLVAPPEGLDLEDKQAIARLVAARGGDIGQLNTLRRCLSAVKAGGLARASGAGKLVSVIISDVLGDPLETIASGPTWLESAPDPCQSLETLEQLDLLRHPDLQRVVSHLRKMEVQPAASDKGQLSVSHVVLGNNATAANAAREKANALGYRTQSESSPGSEGDVMKLADAVVTRISKMRGGDEVDCWISGGEPTVVLPQHGSGKGGRNQQLVVAVANQLVERGWPGDESQLGRFAFLSGGTDGEDGPTDAAGGYIDAQVLQRSRELGLEMESYIQEADTYNFLGPAGGLLQTGPTGTNVCDVRVALREKLAFVR